MRLCNTYHHNQLSATVALFTIHTGKKPILTHVNFIYETQRDIYATVLMAPVLFSPFNWRYTNISIRGVDKFTRNYTQDRFGTCYPGIQTTLKLEIDRQVFGPINTR